MSTPKTRAEKAMTYADTVKFLVAMIVMMNPLGSLSIFLQLTGGSTLKKQRKIALRCGVAMTIIMVASIWVGSETLALLSITIDSFRFAGGIILLLVGLSMLQSQESPVNHNPEDDVALENRDAIAIVPLALPIIIGPGAISTLVIASNDYPQLVNKFGLSGFCLLLAGGMCLMLYFGPSIAKFVGESVMKVITRIMGMIVMSLAVGMLANGLIGLIPALH
ncbi:MAG: MarC family protein [Gammaproteobacteria bacterium]